MTDGVIADQTEPVRPRVILLGSDELSRELAIALRHLGAEIIAVDQYPDAPAHAVADQSVVLAMTERVGKDAFLRQQRAIMGRPDNRPNLPKIHCETIVICGRQDQMTPLAWNEEIAALIPGAKLEIIEDCGHLSTMERVWEVSVELRQWLTE